MAEETKKPASPAGEAKRTLRLTGEGFVSLFCRDFDSPARDPALTEKALSRIRSAAKKAGIEYRIPEALELEVDCGGTVLTASVSCSGIYCGEGGTVIDGIAVHWGAYPVSSGGSAHTEARLYAALYCRSSGEESVTLRKIYYCGSNGSVKIFSEKVSAGTLEEELYAACGRVKLAVPRVRREGAAVRFPFSALREGQRELMEDCYRAIRRKTDLLACAPTGTGKTLSFLYPGLKALEKGRISRVIFVTPRGSVQRQIAAAASSCDPGRAFGQPLILFSRQSACPQGAERCLRDKCPLFCGMGSRIYAALLELIGSDGVLDRETVSSCAARHGVCPYELAMSAARLCGVIVGDYNFVFDPVASLDFLADSRTLVLCDEAHGLPDRISGALSAVVDGDVLNKIREVFDPLTPGELKAAEDLEAVFAANRARLADGGDRFFREPSQEALKASDALLRLLRLRPEPTPEMTELTGSLRAFARAHAAFSRGYVRAITQSGGEALILADPSDFIRSARDAFGSAVYFSATLLPEEYYSRVLGMKPSDEFVSYPSPFDPSNFLIMLSPLKTSISGRGASLNRLGSLVAAACSKPGRYIVFFPSFEYLNSAEKHLKLRLPAARIISQKPVMSGAERRAFLRRLEESRGTGIALCVLGGLFAEGVELSGASLDGVVIVGTGMPPPSEDREAAGFYFEDAGLDGKAYSYALPGFNRVLQAVGRVIRKDDDVGFALLCDDRYLDGGISQLFAPHWDEPVICPDASDVRRALMRFRGEI